MSSIICRIDFHEYRTILYALKVDRVYQHQHIQHIWMEAQCWQENALRPLLRLRQEIPHILQKQAYVLPTK